MAGEGNVVHRAVKRKFNSTISVAVFNNSGLSIDAFLCYFDKYSQEFQIDISHKGCFYVTFSKIPARIQFVQLNGYKSNMDAADVLLILHPVDAGKNYKLSEGQLKFLDGLYYNHYPTTFNVVFGLKRVASNEVQELIQRNILKFLRKEFVDGKLHKIDSTTDMLSLLNMILETNRKDGTECGIGDIRIKRYKGRKNIKQVYSENELTEASQNAKLKEDKRRHRVVERQKLQNEFFVNAENSSRLILEVASANHEPIVEVNPELVKLAKPHQVKGIRFMWDCVIESADMVKQNGSGCILAHSMGLGKTFQIITFLHTVLTHRFINQHIKYALIICPVNTIKNWFSEFQQWLGVRGLLAFSVYDLSDSKTQSKRAETLKAWRKSGGVLLCGITIFSQLVNPKGKKMKCPKRICDIFIEALVRPGPDIVVIDEGHLLKNNQSNFNAAVSSITTLRRIILTGTPLQNNLEEYYVMVNFVKPYLLGTKKEFTNRFVNPINNGQHIDSTPKDVAIMKKSVHVLHRFLDGFVQRFDYTILKPYLQRKFEFVISIKLTKIQIELYRYYLENVSKCDRSSLLEDFANLRLIWNHPDLLYRVYAKRNKKQSSIPDDIDSMSTFDSSDSDEFDVSSELSESGPQSHNIFQNSWFNSLLSSYDTAQLDLSSKMLVLFHILEKCEEIGDKVIVFTQSLDTLDFIQECLEAKALNKGTTCNSYSWENGIDYFRIDGSVKSGLRKSYIDNFNSPDNPRARLFLLSTKAGGLGINLVGANRCVIFDASWNPSHDVQAIFRIYRFGQIKPVFIYRLIAQGTMEEQIYKRQVNKQCLFVRVVDELQVSRHFKFNELQQLYKFSPDLRSERPILNIPNDHILADVIFRFKDLIINYHEHDSLLENRPEENLSEAERKLAWQEFERTNSKSGMCSSENVASVGNASSYRPTHDPKDTFHKLLHCVQNKIKNQKQLEVLYKQNEINKERSMFFQAIQFQLKSLETLFPVKNVSKDVNIPIVNIDD